MEEPVEYNAGKKEEERIRVLVSKNPCDECAVKQCTRKCMFRILFEKAPGITRQEAIEKIAKALCLCDDDGGCKGVCNPKCDVWKYSLNHAEAALDALLGD